MFKGFDDNTLFQHTAARRRLAKQEKPAQEAVKVSTHSRPKAAGACLQHALNRCRVSTHSRPKAAGKIEDLAMTKKSVSTHSRPKAAGLKSLQSSKPNSVSTHSRPKAAGFETICINACYTVSTHSRPKAAGLPAYSRCDNGWFQHTAARRRLAKRCSRKKTVTGSFNTQPPEGGWPRHYINGVFLDKVSTHSRPKAAGFCLLSVGFCLQSFNTQPPEGGWCLSQKPCYIRFRKPNLAKLSRKAEMRV